MELIVVTDVICVVGSVTDVNDVQFWKHCEKFDTVATVVDGIVIELILKHPTNIDVYIVHPVIDVGNVTDRKFLQSENADNDDVTAFIVDGSVAVCNEKQLLNILVILLHNVIELGNVTLIKLLQPLKQDESDVKLFCGPLGNVIVWALVQVWNVDNNSVILYEFGISISDKL